MKSLTCVLLTFISFSLFAQNESLFSGRNLATFSIGTPEILSGIDTIISDGVGNGTFTGGTFTYTVDEEFNFIFNEVFGSETHTYIGAVDPGGEYSLFIPDPAVPETGTGIVTCVKLSDNKTNANFEGEFITSYYRYESPGDLFMGLFKVTSDGIGTCTYHELMGTGTTADEVYSYTTDDEGVITITAGGSTPVMKAVINHSDDFFTFASIVDGFPAYGNGVKNSGEIPLSEIQGEYNFAQLRYSDSYGEQSGSLISIVLNDDGTGTYEIDSNSHGENSTGTLVATYQAEGLWEIVLDEESDYAIHCAINPTEKIITGYFNFEGNNPGIIFGFSKDPLLPKYSINGSISGAENVSIEVEGDVTETILVENDGGTYSFELEQGHNATVTPSKEGYSFTPASIAFSNIQSDTTLEAFSAAINTYTLSGRIVGATDVLVSMSGDATGSQTFVEGTPYSFDVNHGQSVTITPTKEGYTFAPASVTVNSIQADSILAAFTATLKTYTLSGTVTGADGVLINLSGDATDSQTIDNGGTYSFQLDYAQSVTITPTKEGYSFTPPSISLSNVMADQTGQDFSAQATDAVQNLTSDNFTIYPNPANQLLNIELEQVESIQLIDLNGKVLESYDCTSKSFLQIDMSSRTAGLYILKITNADGIELRRIVKE